MVRRLALEASQLPQYDFITFSGSEQTCSRVSELFSW